MSPLSCMENALFGNCDHVTEVYKNTPEVLPHHLFILAAVSVSKQINTLYSNEKVPTEGKLDKKEEVISAEKVDDETDDQTDTEKRRIIEMSCTVEHKENPSLTLLLRFDDKMNRQLSCKVGENETAMDLANELVEYGLINKLDREKVALKISENLEKTG